MGAKIITYEEYQLSMMKPHEIIIDVILQFTGLHKYEVCSDDTGNFSTLIYDNKRLNVKKGSWLKPNEKWQCKKLFSLQYDIKHSMITFYHTRLSDGQLQEIANRLDDDYTIVIKLGDQSSMIDLCDKRYDE